MAGDESTGPFEFLTERRKRVRRPPRILVLGHDATRQGAPLVHLRLLEWLRTPSDMEFELVLHRKIRTFIEMTENTLRIQIWTAIPAATLFTVS